MNFNNLTNKTMEKKQEFQKETITILELVRDETEWFFDYEDKKVIIKDVINELIRYYL